jgi:hypothetical protein
MLTCVVPRPPQANVIHDATRLPHRTLTTPRKPGHRAEAHSNTVATPTLVARTCCRTPLAWRQMAGYATLRELVGTVHHLTCRCQPRGSEDSQRCAPMETFPNGAPRSLNDSNRCCSAWTVTCNSSTADALPRLPPINAAPRQRPWLTSSVTSRELVVLAALADGLRASTIARRLTSLLAPLPSIRRISTESSAPPTV